MITMNPSSTHIRSKVVAHAKKYVVTSALFVIVTVMVVPHVDAQVAAPPGPAPTGARVETRTVRSGFDPASNPNSSAFQLSVCDGPTLPTQTLIDQAKKDLGRDYRPCDFNAMMKLVQHLINIMMVLGVLVAIVMFVYAGTLFISGQKAKIDKARSIFPKVFTGFIIMLSAWFIVYQILSWLTDNTAFKTLLGSPS